MIRVSCLGAPQLTLIYGNDEPKGFQTIVFSVEPGSVSKRYPGSEDNPIPTHVGTPDLAVLVRCVPLYTAFLLESVGAPKHCHSIT
jgi:hypothetical protein